MGDERDSMPYGSVVQLFGTLTWERDAAVPHPPSRKAALVLGELILRKGGTLEREALAGKLWPESLGEQSGVNLRRVLTDLRRWLGPEAHRLQSPTKKTLCFETSGLSIDIRLLEAATEGLPAQIIEALALYRGPLLEGSDALWLYGERERYAALALHLALVAGRDALLKGNLKLALRLARRAEEINPLAESAQHLLYEALSVSGDLVLAQAAYRAFRQRLHRELNLDASEELREFAHQLDQAPITQGNSAVALAIFTPDFLPEAARDICGLDLMQLGALAECGQVIPGSRWRLTYPIACTFVDPALRVRFVGHYATLARWIEKAIWSESYEEALARGRSEEINLRRALEWATDTGDFSDILFKGLCQLWDRQATPEVLEGALVVLSTALESPQALLSAPLYRSIRGWRLQFWSRLGLHESARAEAEALLELARMREDIPSQIEISLSLGYIYRSLGDSNLAWECFNAMLALCRIQKSDGWAMDALGGLVEISTDRGEIECALAYSDEELALAHMLSSQAGVLLALNHRALLWERGEHWEEAELIWEELRERAERVGDQKMLRESLEGLARGADRQGRTRLAERLRGRVAIF